MTTAVKAGAAWPRAGVDDARIPFGLVAIPVAVLLLVRPGVRSVRVPVALLMACALDLLGLGIAPVRVDLTQGFRANMTTVRGTLTAVSGHVRHEVVENPQRASNVGISWRAARASSTRPTGVVRGVARAASAVPAARALRGDESNASAERGEGLR